MWLRCTLRLKILIYIRRSQPAKRGPGRPPLRKKEESDSDDDDDSDQDDGNHSNLPLTSSSSSDSETETNNLLPIYDPLTLPNKPKGLIDGLSKFFTPTNRRKSRVAISSLVRSSSPPAEIRTGPRCRPASETSTAPTSCGGQLKNLFHGLSHLYTTSDDGDDAVHSKKGSSTQNIRHSMLNAADKSSTNERPSLTINQTQKTKGGHDSAVNAWVKSVANPLSCGSALSWLRRQQPGPQASRRSPSPSAESSESIASSSTSCSSMSVRSPIKSGKKTTGKLSSSLSS